MPVCVIVFALNALADEALAMTDDSVEFQYLGVGGWLMSWRGHRILTAPFFSNPSLLRTGLGKIACRPDIIEQFLPDVTDVRSILAGHSHYDHIFDLPYIVPARAPQATVYGNETMRHILVAALPERQLATVDHLAAKWIRLPDTPIRFMPLFSEHAPHFGGLKFFSGRVHQDLGRLPDRARDWKEGQTFAFLIDFLYQDGAVALRVHYQDAASTPPLGFPPPLNGADEHPVDLAITCLASFEQVKNYPEHLLRYLQPVHVFAGHWEDFFRPLTLPVRVVPFSDAIEFKRRVRTVVPDAAYHLPNPGEIFHIAPRNDRATVRQYSS